MNCQSFSILFLIGLTSLFLVIHSSGTATTMAASMKNINPSNKLLQNYLNIRNKIRCSLNSNLCHQQTDEDKKNETDDNKLNVAYEDDDDERPPCLSGIPSLNCKNKNNNGEDLLDDYMHDPHNPGK